MTIAIFEGLITEHGPFYDDRGRVERGGGGEDKRSLGQVDRTRGAADINLNERVAPLTIHRVI